MYIKLWNKEKLAIKSILLDVCNYKIIIFWVLIKIIVYYGMYLIQQTDWKLLILFQVKNLY